MLVLPKGSCRRTQMSLIGSVRGHIQDETYFHTVLFHDKDLVVTTDVVTYVPTGRPNSPTMRWMVLQLRELPAVWRSGAAFARKVDPTERPEVLRALNAEVDRRRAADPMLNHQDPLGPTKSSPAHSEESESPASSRRASPSSGCTAAERPRRPGCW